MSGPAYHHARAFHGQPAFVGLDDTGGHVEVRCGEEKITILVRDPRNVVLILDSQVVYDSKPRREHV